VPVTIILPIAKVGLKIYKGGITHQGAMTTIHGLRGVIPARTLEGVIVQSNVTRHSGENSGMGTEEENRPFLSHTQKREGKRGFNKFDIQ
jgi:hypothetical protein